MLMMAALDAQYGAVSRVSPYSSLPLVELVSANKHTGARTCNNAQLARNVHNCASLLRVFLQRLLLQHLCQCSPRDQPRPLVIHPRDPVKRLCGRLRRPERLSQYSRAVHRIIDSRERPRDLARQGIDKGLVRDIPIAGGDLRLGLIFRTASRVRASESLLMSVMASREQPARAKALATAAPMPVVGV